MSDAELRAIHALHDHASILFPHSLFDHTRYDQDALRHLSHTGNKTKWPPSWLSRP